MIRFEQFLTADNKPVDFSLKIDNNKKKPSGFPPEDYQRKMLYKLQELKVLKLQPNNDIHDMPLFGEPTRFSLTLNKHTFDDLYKTFEIKFGYEAADDAKGEQPENPPRTYDQPIINEKALELIAEDLSSRNSHATLDDFFRELKIPAGIEAEGSKKVRVLSILRALALTDKDKLFQFIEEAVHPLRFGADDERAKATVEKYNNFMKYDGWQIVLPAENGFVPDIVSAGTINQVIHEGQKGVPQDPDKISLLRQAYQVLMNIVEIFCYNPTEPDVQLNKFYTYLDKLVWDTIDELRIHNLFYHYRKPFTNLFAAEKECGGKVAWAIFRPEMQAMFGQIETLYQEQNGSDILAEPDTQKQLNDIKLYLSELKGKLRETVNQQQEKEQPLDIGKIFGNLPDFVRPLKQNLTETKTALETQFDDKIQSFLLLIKHEIELTGDAETVGIKYKSLSPIFEADELAKYFKYLEGKKLFRLKHISKQPKKDKKLFDDTFVTKTTPDHELIEPEQFYEVKRYYKLNYYPEDIFIFTCDKKAIDTFLNKPNGNTATGLPLYISATHGIYFDRVNKSPSYPISGKRAKLVQLLITEKLSASQLCQILSYKTESLLSKEIEGINANFRSMLEQAHDLVTHLPTGGYVLNTDRYNIQVLEKQTFG